MAFMASTVRRMLRLNVADEVGMAEVEVILMAVVVGDASAMEATERGMADSQGLAPQERVGRWL
jgi:hypothetical protein